MDVAYRDKKYRNHFIKYTGSGLVLSQLSKKYLQLYNDLCKVLEVQDPNYPLKKKGSRVARLFYLMLCQKLKVEQKLFKHMDLPGEGQKTLTFSNLLSIYGCKSLCDLSVTKRHLTLVLGGRVRNEKPELPYSDPDSLVISMDLASCYGKGLQAAQ